MLFGFCYQLVGGVHTFVAVEGAIVGAAQPADKYFAFAVGGHGAARCRRGDVGAFGAADGGDGYLLRGAGALVNEYEFLCRRVPYRRDFDFEFGAGYGVGGTCRIVRTIDTPILEGVAEWRLGSVAQGYHIAFDYLFVACIAIAGKGDVGLVVVGFDVGQPLCVECNAFAQCDLSAGGVVRAVAILCRVPDGEFVAFACGCIGANCGFSVNVDGVGLANTNAAGCVVIERNLLNINGI